MRLLIIHNRYRTDNIGGEDIVYENELRSLQTMLGKENVFSYEVSNDNISRFRLLFSIWFSFTHYNNVKKIVKQNKIDLVHVHNFYPLLTPSVFKAAKDSGAKVIHTLHNYRLWCLSGIFYREGFGVCEQCTNHKFSFKGILNQCYRKSLSQSMVAQYSFWFYRLIKVFDNIDYFFVLTNFQKEKVKTLGIDEKKIILKPNSINRAKVNQNDKNGYIFVGRLEESKGIVELLKVWKDIDDKFILTIIGGGELQEKLKKVYNQKNIIFKGKCSRTDTLKTIAKSKYLIQPSLLYETFGLTILEAMSYGVPVIGLNLGTRKDFIYDEVNGFLYNEKNLKEVIEKSYEYENYDILSENALSESKEFEDEYVINKQIEIYKKILEENR